MINFPDTIAITLLTFGLAMIIVCLVGKVTIKEIEFGTNNSWARTALGFLGSLLIVLTLASYIPLHSDCKAKVNPRPDPTIFVRDHYESIRSQAYYTAWKRLPKDLKNDLTMHPDGYLSFLKWFEKVNPIKITELLITDCQNRSDVTVKVTYISESADANFESIKFSLLCRLKWNNSKKYWEFVDIRPI